MWTGMRVYQFHISTSTDSKRALVLLCGQNGTDTNLPYRLSDHRLYQRQTAAELQCIIQVPRRTISRVICLGVRLRIIDPTSRPEALSIGLQVTALFRR